MKLYTEEQVVDFTMNMIHQYEFGNKKIWWNKELLIELIQYVTPIELPSDEEIGQKFKYSSEENRQALEIGAKWMQKRMYSEEEVKKLIIDFLFEIGIGREVENVEEWFEQFKKL